MMTKITFDELPLSPSVNDCYLSVRKGRHSTIILTEAYRSFKSEMERYGKERAHALYVAGELINKWVREGYVLRCDLICVFPEKDLFTKTKSAKSKYKRMDADNRIKPMRDALSKMLGVDDTLFFSGNAEKVVGDSRWAMVQIVKTKVRTLKDIRTELGLFV